MTYLREESKQVLLRLVVALAVMAVLTPAVATAQSAADSALTVVYPKADQQLPAVDSTFIFGQAPPEAQLTINGTVVPVYRTGGFLAFLPIDTGEFVFHLEATYAGRTDTLAMPVRVGHSADVISDSVLAIVPESLIPRPHHLLVPGDYLEVSFKGTPGCQAHFGIDGVAGSFPMTELGPSPGDSRWGEVFDENATSAQQIRPGRYHGVWEVPHGLKLDSAHIRVCLARDTTILDTLTADSLPTYCGITEAVFDEVPGTISVGVGGVPRVVELTDSMQTLRFGPRLGYLTIFQPAGVRAVYAGEDGDWVRLRLASGHTAWVEKEKTKVLPEGTPIPGGLISYIRTVARDRWTDVTLDLSRRLPFKVRSDPERGTVTIAVFGATTNTDWVRYDTADDFIERIEWNQNTPGVYELTVYLTREIIWGYETTYRDNRLVLSLRHPPDLHRSLRGITVCIDPGHALSPGAIGPTGLKEKEANLGISLELQKQLEERGADVVLTRTADVELPLYDRPAIARAADADIFVSIHNNALPDGINPFVNNGTSSYYYHPQSRRLAQTVHARLVRATGLRDYGQYHANFAVLRPTQYPSVLLECAFMMIPEQEEKLRSRGYRRRIAKAIAEGLEDYIESFPRHEQ